MRRFVGKPVVKYLAVTAVVVIIVWLIWAGYSYESSLFLLVGILLALPFTIWLIGAGYSYKWTGFGGYIDSSSEGGNVRGKTLWDWLQLIIIPATLLLGGYLLNNAQQERESSIAQLRIQEDRRIAEDSAQETTLQNYLDQMGKLLIENKLSSNQTEETKNVARVWTLTVVRRINGERKGIVLQFLHESSLIQNSDPIVSLENVNLSGAILDRADLSGANLWRAHLNGAILRGADFSGADLSGAGLWGADLSGADLSGADLGNTVLYEADLRGANLSKANLQGAELSAKLLGIPAPFPAQYTKETIWPDGFDPEKAGAILVQY